MNAELEALILAYDLLLETKHADRKEAYDRLLDETMEKHPGMSRESLNTLVVFAHRQWARGQRAKPTSLPPSA